MADRFQAEPPRWSSEQPTPYDHYAEVNLRRPEKQASGVPWAIVAVAAAFLSVGLIGLMGFGIFMWPSAPVLTPVPVTMASAAAPPLVLVPADDEAMTALHGSWIASVLIVDGNPASDAELARVKLTMERTGFKLNLPTTQKEGPSWTIQSEPGPNPKANLDVATNWLDFLLDDGGTLTAIYQLEGDTLKMCLSQDGAPRPADFTSKKGSKRLLLVLQRQEP